MATPIRYASLTGAFDHHAITVSPAVYEPALEQQRCAQAFREVDPSFPGQDLGFVCGPDYANLFQLFTGIQVAGPRLGPTSVDKGFHAIPQHPSGYSTLPACFYNPGDYTCVKDAQAEWWDASGQAPGDNRPGCWKSIGVNPTNPDAKSNRSLPDKWPGGNIDAQMTANDPCNGHSAVSVLNPNR